MNLIKPPSLKSGDTIAVVSPSWGGAGCFPRRYEAGKRQLMENFHVNVIEMPHALKPPEWVYANPKARAEDIMQAFSDPKIQGIIASIGGDDSIRLLPYLDLDVIQKNPKVFMGYSDTTVLHFACLKAGIRSFYGPSIMAGFGESGGLFHYMKDAVFKTVFSNEIIGTVPQADSWTVEHSHWENPKKQTVQRKRETPLGWTCLQGTGVHSGFLIGGCIDVLPMILGTSLWPTIDYFDGAILFVETSEEAPPVDDIKRIMRNLGVQGILERLNGILIGRPGGNVQNLRQYDEGIQTVVRAEFGLADLPIIAQVDFGHTDPMCVLPYGMQTQINCETTSITFLESGCS